MEKSNKGALKRARASLARRPVRVLPRNRTEHYEALLDAYSAYASLPKGSGNATIKRARRKFQYLYSTYAGTYGEKTPDEAKFIAVLLARINQDPPRPRTRNAPYG